MKERVPQRIDPERGLPLEVKVFLSYQRAAHSGNLSQESRAQFLQSADKWKAARFTESSQVALEGYYSKLRTEKAGKVKV